MTRVEDAADLTASPEAVMAVLLDVGAYPTWQREVARVEVEERDERGRPAVATTWIRAVGRAGSYTVAYSYPSDVEMSYRLVRADMMSRHDGRFVVTPRPAGSRLQVTLDLVLRWPVPGLVVGTLMRKGVADMLAAVGRMFDEGVPDARR